MCLLSGVFEPWFTGVRAEFRRSGRFRAHRSLYDEAEPRMKTVLNALLLAGVPGHGSHLLQGGSIAVCIPGFQVSMFTGLVARELADFSAC